MTLLQKIDAVLKCLFDHSGDNPTFELVKEWLNDKDDLDVGEIRDCLKKLHKDGFLYYTKNDVFVEHYHDSFNFLISFDGKYFWVTEHGYEERERVKNINLAKIEIENDQDRLNQKLLVNGAILAAVGTIAVFELEMYEHYPCASFYILGIIVLITILLNRSHILKKRK